MCCGNAPRAAPSLFLTQCKTSCSRCLCRVERAWLARPLVGCLRVGWWVLALGRMGEEGRCPSSPHSRTQCTHRRARGHRLPPPPHYSTGPTVQTLNGKKRVGATTATRPPWGTVCPTMSSTQLGVAVSEKRRTRETVCPLVCGRKREHHAHSLAMARVDTLQRLGESWISTSSIWLSPTLKPRSLERREQECATRSLMSARV